MGRQGTSAGHGWVWMVVSSRLGWSSPKCLMVTWPLLADLQWPRPERLTLFHASCLPAHQPRHILMRKHVSRPLLPANLQLSHWSKQALRGSPGSERQAPQLEGKGYDCRKSTATKTINVVSPSTSHCPPFPLFISLSGCLLPHSWKVAATLNSSLKPKQTELISDLPLASELCPPSLFSLSFLSTQNAHAYRQQNKTWVSAKTPLRTPLFHVLQDFQPHNSSWLRHQPLPSLWSLFSFGSHMHGPE